MDTNLIWACDKCGQIFTRTDLDQKTYDPSHRPFLALIHVREGWHTWECCGGKGKVKGFNLNSEIDPAEEWFYGPIVEALLFLQQHPSIQPLVKEAIDQARRLFPATCRLTLRKVAHPEGGAQLVLFASFPVGAEDEVFPLKRKFDSALMQRFDTEWWLNLPVSDQRLFYAIEVEFVEEPCSS